jgi:hypothetical protein
MNTSTRRLFGGLATAAVLLLGQGGFVRAADPSATPIPAPPSGPTGNEMLSVQPSLISISAKPGATTSTELTVRSAANLSVKIKAQGLGQSRDGNFVAIPPESDTGAFSARPMITATPENLELKPGDTVKVTVNVTLPTDAGEGTRYAILSITGFPPTPTGSSNVGFGVDLGVSTIVQIANTAQTRTAAIDGIDVGKSLPGQALPVAVAFKNTGNTHFGAIPNELLATAVLQDASGTELATATARGRGHIPHRSRRRPQGRHDLRSQGAGLHVVRRCGSQPDLRPDRDAPGEHAGSAHDRHRPHHRRSAHRRGPRRAAVPGRSAHAPAHEPRWRRRREVTRTRHRHAREGAPS